ncbi:MAG: glucosaminidase domain-containing protein [Intestinibacter bartlettii]|uniref:glycoside hydrolase family 73 protein n=1 Tax=Intestinibacter bartlettii TaxID=261299 RepID=UPI002912139D|nr:glucosaminidase domain-containing protein [Intestinibacter bartlettii]MDU6791650.1 glucosaminidase domain-containing protein [Anaerococcus sp.]MDU6824502.1 glucosaminidase domain-containing protein [Intestinibacter bartlettii]
MNIKKSKFILSSFIILSSALATSNTSLADDLEYQDKVSEVYEKYSESIEKSNNQNDKTTESSDELNTVKKDELDGSKENPVIKNENASNESNSNKELEKKDNLSKEPNIENDGTLNEEKNKILDKNNQSNTNQNSFTNDESSNNQLEISSEIKNVNVKSPSNTKNIQINTLSNKNNYINSYNTKEEFLKMLDSHSDLAMHYNIFPEVMMGQAILESGWGQSRLSKQSKNIFGVKVPYNEIGQGKGDLYDTKEFIDGKYVTVKAEFRRFNTYEESLRQYLSLLNGNHYNKFKVNKATNYKDQLARIKNAGYATDPNYVNSVLNVIEKNILPKYAYNKVLTANYSDTKVSYPKNS